MVDFIERLRPVVQKDMWHYRYSVKLIDYGTGEVYSFTYPIDDVERPTYELVQRAKLDLAAMWEPQVPTEEN